MSSNERHTDKPYIYAIFNIINGRCYIGRSTIKPSIKFSGYRSRLNKDRFHQKELQAEWNTCGEESFEFSELEYVENDDAVSKEQEYIDMVGDDLAYNKKKADSTGLLT